MTATATEKSYYRCSESTVEVRTFTPTGHIIRYRKLVWRGKERVFHCFLYFSDNTSRFGAIRDLVRHIRSFDGRYWVGELVDIRRRGKSTVDYVPSNWFDD